MKRPTETQGDWEIYAKWLERELSQWKDCAEQWRLKCGEKCDELAKLNDDDEYPYTVS